MGIFDWLFVKKKELEETESGSSDPPSAERVARRAMVLSLIMYRASLENFPGEPHYEALQRRLSTWVDELGLDSELEKEERAFLRGRLGRADEKAVCNAGWRNEGVGALAWALGRFELPPYDEGADPRAAGSSVGFSEELLAAMDTAPAHDLLSHAELRPASEIDHFASHITIVDWRLRTYRLTSAQLHGGIEVDLSGGTYSQLSPEQTAQADFPKKQMDFLGYLRAHPSFKESWLDGLRLVDGDLAIGEQSIADASAEAVETCEGIAVERHVAAYWLQGENALYSRVDPATILMGLQ